MKETTDNLPRLNERAFKCAHCNAFAQQRWINRSGLSDSVKQGLDYLHHGHKPQLFADMHASTALEALVTSAKEWLPSHLANNYIASDFSFAECINCKKFSVWLKSEMIYPASTPFPAPNEDLEDHIKRDYLEAAKIFNASPRASAALLRLCAEKICRQLNETKNLSTNIHNLVKKGGMKPEVQKALDYCRVTGNKFVHPGIIKELSEEELSEERERVKVLFKLINYIAEEMITKPKEIKEIYDSLPEESRTQIAKRDKNTQADEQ